MPLNTKIYLKELRNTRNNEPLRPCGMKDSN